MRETLSRRIFLRATGVLGAGGALGALFPEVAGASSSYKQGGGAKNGKTWFSQEVTGRRELTSSERSTIGKAGLAEVGLAMQKHGKDGGQDPLATVGQLADGTSLVVVAAALADGSVMAHYAQLAHGRVKKSAAQLWATSETEKSAALVSSGTSYSSLAKPVASFSSKSDALAHPDVYCTPDGPCASCAAYDNGLVDCCGPCVFAFAAWPWGVACVIAWCSWCLSEHCSSWVPSCCGD